MSTNSPAYSLFYLLIKFQLIHQYSSQVSNIITNLLASQEFLEPAATWSIFRAILANPLPFQSKQFGRAAKVLIQQIETLQAESKEHDRIVVKGQNSNDPVLTILETPERFSIFSIAANTLQGFGNLLQLGAYGQDVQKSLYGVMGVTYQQEDITLQVTTESYQEMLN